MEAPQASLASERLSKSISHLGRAFVFEDGRRPSYFGLLELSSKPFFLAAETGAEELVADLRAHKDALLEEALVYEHWIAKDTESNAKWSIRYVSRDGELVSDAPPLLREIIERHACCCTEMPFAAVILSRLEAGGEIQPHYGPTNLRVRLQFPLSPVDECRLVCGGTVCDYTPEGYAIIDDSYLHAASNHGAHVRIMLVIDLWHPNVSTSERKAISSLFAEHLA